MPKAIYNSIKCGIFCLPKRHFNASQMHVKKDHSIDLKFWYVICDMFDTKLYFAPFLQIFIFMLYCILRILYGFEIININKKTLKTINICQNDIVRYITGWIQYGLLQHFVSSHTKLLLYYNLKWN